MSHQQREALDSMLRSAPSTVAATIQEQRAAYEEFLSMFPVPDGIRHEPTEIGGRPALLVSPQTKQTEQTEQRAGTILYLHGGAWVMGSPQGYLSLTANLVRVAGIPAISPDYRLAPEHPFPAAVEDTLAAYRDLLEQGHESSSIIFAGDSAGGGLSITAALSAQAAGLPMPAGIVAFSPGLDITWSGASITERRHLDPVFTPESLIAMTSSYIGAADPAQPLLSPALGADLTGLPPHPSAGRWQRTHAG
jgi:acetyl esterase/lipase